MDLSAATGPHVQKRRLRSGRKSLITSNCDPTQGSVMKARQKMRSGPQGNDPFTKRRMTRSTVKPQPQGQQKKTRSAMSFYRRTGVTIEMLREVGERGFVPPPTPSRKFTKEEFDAYSKRVEESGGFDVGVVPRDVCFRGMIRPLFAEYLARSPIEEHEKLAESALGDYNRKNDTSYQFVKLIRVNYQASGMYRLFYITFQAKDGIAGCPPQNFQAIVRKFLKIEVLVLLCRVEEPLKPSQGPGETSQKQ